MAIAFISPGAQTPYGSVTTGKTIAVTYAPVNGNTVVAFLSTTGTTPSVTLVDSGSNALTAGPTFVQGANDLIQAFTYVAGSGVTGFTATWITTNRTGSLLILEYSGVSSVNGSLTGNTAGASASLSLTITCTTLVANAWLVAGFCTTNTASWTAGTGNLRSTLISGTNNARSTAVDNTSASAGSVTCSCTASLSSATWSGIAIELDPVITGTVLRELNLLGIGV